MKSKEKLKRMVIISLFAAIMCIFAPFIIPVGVMPLSLSTFVLYLTAVILGKTAVFPILVYILIGAVGLPVFSGGVGGLERLFGPTGGFIFGYIPCAVISGIIASKAKNNKMLCFIGILAGTMIMYLIGVPWMVAFLGTKSIDAAFSVIAVNVLPFVPVDIIKMILAVVLGYSIQKRVKL